MTESDVPTGDDQAPESVRTERWDCDGPAELDLSVEIGRLELTLTEDATTVEAEVRADPQPGAAWHQGLSGLLGWLGEATGRSSIQVGGWGFPFGDELDAAGRWGLDWGPQAVRATEVSWSPTARRLVVRSPSALPLRLVPLVVTVRAPAGSRLALRTGSGDITVSGRAGEVATRTGSGEVRLDAVDGDLDVTAGSGEVRAGQVRGRTRARTGSGDLMLAGVDGPAEARAGSGAVRLGGVRAEVVVRSGSGDLTIDDAETGRLDLTTGSGDVRIGLHAGVSAELDLSSGSGRVRSELDVAEAAPSGAVAAVVVRGRTGSGDVLVTRAAPVVG